MHGKASSSQGVAVESDCGGHCGVRRVVPETAIRETRDQLNPSSATFSRLPPSVRCVRCSTLPYHGRFMSSISPAIRNLAERLLESEPALAASHNGDADLALRACERLRVPLTKLAGSAGFSSLLSRALALAKRQAPALDVLRVGADGSLLGLDESHNAPEIAEARRQGTVILLAEFLALLVTFIGAPLMFSLVRQAWPEASSEIFSLRTEEKP
jgi:hypothetical protein